MFSWATSQLEILAQTVAPPPSDPKSKFIIACQKGDEEASLQLLNSDFLDPLREVIHSVKGWTALHLACLHGMQRVAEQILARQQPQDQGSFMYILDGEGNTPLHSACMSRDPGSLALVKRLVELAGKPSVGVRNSAGQTPYDVASLNSVRQYLLPIQLQAETQAALDNGGIGLVPGMDLCGLHVTPKNVAPPPMMRQPIPAYSRSASVPINGADDSPGDPSQPSSMFATPPPQPPIRSLSSPEETTRPPPAPPSSGQSQYAYRGSSSAAMKTVKGIQPDGFHSSSSDKNLQEKYGHQAVNIGNALPPPPSSGNSVGSLGISGPPSGNGVNPYSGRLTALGNNGRPTNRYVSYDPIQGVHPPPPQHSPVASAASVASNRFTSPGAPPTRPGGLPNFVVPPPPVGSLGISQGPAATPNPSTCPSRQDASSLFSRPSGTTPPSSFPKPPGSAPLKFAPPPALTGSANGGSQSTAGSSFPKPPTMIFSKPPSFSVNPINGNVPKPPNSVFSRPPESAPSPSSSPADVTFQTNVLEGAVASEPSAPETSSPTPSTKVASPVGDEELMDEVPLTPGQVKAGGVPSNGLMTLPPLMKM